MALSPLVTLCSLGLSLPSRPSSTYQRGGSPAASILWTPSSRGEPGQSPRDLEFGPLGQIPKYCESLSVVSRRPTRTVRAGKVLIGSEHPLVRQTMATTLTSDVDASVDQIMRCADEG